MEKRVRRSFDWRNFQNIDTDLQDRISELAIDEGIRLCEEQQQKGDAEDKCNADVSDDKKDKIEPDDEKVRGERSAQDESSRVDLTSPDQTTKWRTSTTLTRVQL